MNEGGYSIVHRDRTEIQTKSGPHWMDGRRRVGEGKQCENTFKSTRENFLFADEFNFGPVFTEESDEIVFEMATWQIERENK